MGTLGQLSELQRAFVQFCNVLQDLILNHEVTHSVVQSLHNDLPTLQPDQPGTKAQFSTNTVSSAPAVSSSLASKPDLKLSAAERLKHMAPRLTPTAADTALDPTAASDPSYRLTIEVQDNFIVLQNATSRSRELLARLTQLRAAALTALTRQGEGWGQGSSKTTTQQGEGQRQQSTDASAVKVHEDRHNRYQATDSATAAAIGTPAEEEKNQAVTRTSEATTAVTAGAAGNLGRPEETTRVHTDMEIGMDMDVGSVEVDVELWDTSTLEQWPPATEAVFDGLGGDMKDTINGPGGRVEGEGGRGADVARSLLGPPAVTVGSGEKAAATRATAPTLVGGPGTRGAGRLVIGEAVERAAVLSGGELVVLMGELVREAALEVEVLGHVAAAVDLTSPSDELYVYGTLLKLQPYLDERVLGAALGQRDLLVPPSQTAAVAAKPRQGGQLTTPGSSSRR